MALTLIPGGGTPEDWTTLLKKKGKELAQIPYNAYVLFKYHADFRGTIRWNKVTLTVEVLGGVLKDCPDPTNFDTVVTHAQDYLASVHDLSLGREEVGRRLAYVAMENGYDPLKDYLDGLVWDNQKRVDTWLIDYAGAKPTSPDDGYVSFVGRKFIVSTVARAYQPGCKADVVLVAEGGQGSHKSTMFKNLGGEWYTEASGVLGDKDSKQLIGAAWICELPDMSSFSRTNRNSMKAFFSSSVDRYRPPYDKATIATPRRCCFVATTNDEQYLLDPTGNRRFHPVMLGEIDRAAIYKNRNQLFQRHHLLSKA
jgi:predicted P-loop ATPase